MKCDPASRLAEEPSRAFQRIPYNAAAVLGLRPTGQMGNTLMQGWLSVERLLRHDTVKHLCLLDEVFVANEGGHSFRAAARQAVHSPDRCIHVTTCCDEP